ncbi:hypothetical protein EVAR_64351_1 [Eumeta japonica]|uniref:Uncharacterized protein n=1 Tax=Eumeta variegata TaxID=151549 RepID=A0A4C1ZJ96_EUMVA|nr:hypothetical protein EVAR_64351_1 [Eumeta japonica]
MTYVTSHYAPKFDIRADNTTVIKRLTTLLHPEDGTPHLSALYQCDGREYPGRARCTLNFERLDQSHELTESSLSFDADL